MHTLNINIPTKKPGIIHDALKPELRSSPTKKSEIELKKHKDSIELFIKSKEISSFRAAINSWLRWIQVAKKSTQINKKI